MVSAKAMLGFRETVRAPLWLYMLGGLVAGSGFGVVSGFALVEILDRNSLEPVQGIIIYVAGVISALLGLAIWNRGQMDITVSDAGVELQMGILRRRITWAQVDSVSTPQAPSWPRLFSPPSLVSFVWPTTVWKVPNVPTSVRIKVKAGGTQQVIHISTHRRHELTTILRRNLTN